MYQIPLLHRKLTQGEAALSKKKTLSSNNLRPGDRIARNITLPKWKLDEIDALRDAIRQQTGVYVSRAHLIEACLDLVLECDLEPHIGEIGNLETLRTAIAAAISESTKTT